MKRFSEKEFNKPGILDDIKNKIFIKNNIAYRFYYYTYEHKIYSFVFQKCDNTDKKMYLVQLYGQHFNDYKNTKKLIFSAFDSVQEGATI